MPKMSKFRIALRLAEKVSHHAFRNPDLKKRTESIDEYTAEGIAARIKKSVHKDNRGQQIRPA